MAEPGGPTFLLSRWQRLGFGSGLWFTPLLLAAYDSWYLGFSWWFAPLWIAGGLGLVLCLSRWPRIGVTLTSCDLVVRGAYRTRRIAWSSIRGISIDKLGAGTRIRIRGEGINLRLPAPATERVCRDRQFEEKSHVIGLWWLNHAADGRPMQPSAGVGRR